MHQTGKRKRPRALQACEVCRMRKNRCSERQPCTYCAGGFAVFDISISATSLSKLEYTQSTIWSVHTREDILRGGKHHSNFTLQTMSHN